MSRQSLKLGELMTDQVTNMSGHVPRPSVILMLVKVQAHNSLEPPLEHNQGQMPLMNQGLL